MTEEQLRQLSYGDSWFRYWMPYTFEKLEHPELTHVYLPLNRNYKPLGITSKDWVEYEEFIDQAVAFNRDPSKLKGVWLDTQGLYLYEDSLDSRKDYFERLGKLFSHSMRLVERAKP